MFLALRNKLTLFDSFFKPFSRRGALMLFSRQARIYRLLTLLAGLGGYGFLLLFPALLVAMPVALFYTVQPVMSEWQWFLVTVEVLSLTIGIVMTYAITAMRFPLPSGLELTPACAPRLFELLQELIELYGVEGIDRVVLRDRFVVRVIRTPRNGFAFSTTRTLVIGLPVLLTISPLDVHVLLARRVGQLAGKGQRLDSWLYSLRDMWDQYISGCALHSPLFARPVCSFFASYAPFYRSFSVGVARSSELYADRCALQAVNDRDVVRGITGQVLTEAYLCRSYWPAVLEAGVSGSRGLSPHADMAKVFEHGLPDEVVQGTLQQVSRKKADRRSAIPPLAERLENIGHRKPLLPRPMSVTAARFYLGGAFDRCIEVIDKRAAQKVRSKVIKVFGS
ncbi:MAG TPA: hypothetical protein ENK49_04630 [Gammaproteobacteria bacterium]|nr:hypothetical protein [Gammaproteobacteria bacterium]